jgi:hypothetical protein
MSVTMRSHSVFLYDYRGLGSKHSEIRFDTGDVQCAGRTACLCCDVAESIVFRDKMNRSETLLINPNNSRRVLSRCKTC